MNTRAELFDTMLEQIAEVSKRRATDKYRAFNWWFAKMYFFDEFHEPLEYFSSDGPNDGKIDAFFKTNDDNEITHHCLNSKYTETFDVIAPPTFYDELRTYIEAFRNISVRPKFLKSCIKPELKSRYQKIFDAWDRGKAKLFFLTNHRKNENRHPTVEDLPIKIFYLDDLIQHIVDDIDIAMPRTSTMVLKGINAVLSPDASDTLVPTSIVFAKLIDFIKYLNDDPYHLLFARNVRVGLGNTSVNTAIQDTLENSSKEFVFSNNGITMLCEHHSHDPGTKELTLANPRVVNGSQTLTSILNVESPSPNARVMVRILEISPPRGNNLTFVA